MAKPAHIVIMKKLPPKETEEDNIGGGTVGPALGAWASGVGAHASVLGVAGEGAVGVAGGGAAPPPGVDEETTVIDNFWPDSQCLPKLQM